MRKTVSVLVLALALLLAGCSGVIDQSQESADPTATTNVNETTTNSSMGTSTTVSARKVVEFRELNAQQQAAFRDALQGKATFVPDSSYIDDSAGYKMTNVTPFEVNDYVQYDGELYDIGLSLGKTYSSHIIMAGVTSPPDNATVIAFENLSTNASDVLRTALTNGRYESGVGEWPDGLPGRLGTVQYVRYENQTYELTYGTGDTWAKILTAEKSE